MTTITLNDRELGTVLAALRAYQDSGYGDIQKLPPAYREIAVDGAMDRVPLDDSEIDALCERINTSNESRIHTKFYKLVTALQEISEEAPKSGMPSISDLPERLYPDSYEAIEGYAFDEGMHMQAEVARRALREVGIEPAEGRTEWYHEIEDELSDEMEDA